MSVEEVALNKAMQQYAMEQQHNFQPTDPDAIGGENDAMSNAGGAAENTESKCTFTIDCTPKTSQVFYAFFLFSSKRRL